MSSHELEGLACYKTIRRVDLYECVHAMVAFVFYSA